MKFDNQENFSENNKEGEKKKKKLGFWFSIKNWDNKVTYIDACVGLQPT